MAVETGSLLVRIGADIGDLQKKMTAAQRAVNQLGEGMQSAGKKLSIGMTAPLAALGGFAVSAAASMDSLTRGLTAITGSSAETAAQLKRLEEVAKLPGLGFREAIQGSIRLQAVRIDAVLAERALVAFGNAVATVGGGKAELDGITLALSQIAGKGKVAAEEINQLAERAPQVRAALIDAFGTADTEAIQKMGLTTTQFITRLVEQLERLPTATGGAKNGFENLSDALFRARAAIGDQLLPAVIPLVDGLADLLTRVRTLDPTIVRWGIALASVTAVLGPLLIGVGALTSAITTLAAALGAAGLGSVLLPGGILLAGLATLGALLLKNKLDALAAAGAVDQYKASLATLSQSAAAEKLGDLSRRAEELRAKLKSTPKTIPGLATMSASGVTTTTKPVANPEFERLSAELAEVNQQTLVVVRRLDEIREGSEKAIVAPIVAAQKEMDKLLKQAKEGFLSLAEQFQIGEAVRELNTLGALGTQRPRAPGIAAPRVGLQRGLLGTTGAPELNLKPVLTDALRGIGDARTWGKFFEGPGMFEQLKSGVSDAASALKAKLTPAVLAGGAALAFLAPVFQGLRDVLGSVIEAVAVPLRIVGEVLGTMLVPVLRLLFPPLKYLGVAVSLVAEGIMRALGWFVRSIGKVINALLPGNPARNLVRFGDQLSKSADEIRKKRKELEDMSFNDALDRTTDNLDRLNEAIVNTVRGFHVAAYRFAAASSTPPPPVGGGFTPGGDRPGRPGHPGPVDVGGITIHTSGDARETYRNFYQELDQRTRGAGAAARELFLALPAPV